MGAISGKFATMYLATSTAAAASPVAEQIDFSIETDQSFEEVSALGSTWAVHVLTGSRKWSASFKGNFDTANAQLWTASNANAALRFYLYPVSTATTQFYHGFGWIKLGSVIAGGNTAAPKTSVTVQGEGELFKAP